MRTRPKQKLIDSLRVTLSDLERNTGPSQDARAFADLKRLLLLPIAELEAAAEASDKEP